MVLGVGGGVLVGRGYQEIAESPHSLWHCTIAGGIRKKDFASIKKRLG